MDGFMRYHRRVLWRKKTIRHRCFLLVCIFIYTSMRLGWRQFSTKAYSIKKVFNTGVPLMQSSVLVVLMSATDIIVIGFYSDSVSVALYSAANKIAALGSLFLVLINVFTNPRFAVLYRRSMADELRILVNRSLFVGSLLGIVIFLVISVNSRYFMSFFGEDFERGAMALIILAFGQSVLLATGPSSSFMMMCGKESQLRKSSFYALLLNLILNFLLVPIYSFNGAAIATTVSLIMKNILNFMVMKRAVATTTIKLG